MCSVASGCFKSAGSASGGCNLGLLGDMNVMEKLTSQRRIHVDVLKHRATGLLMAVSDDLPGLHVAADTTEELQAELPIVIKALIEASEKHHVAVSSVEEISLDGWERRYFKFTSEPMAA